MIEEDIISRARFLKCENVQRTNYDATEQAVRELADDLHLRDTYNLFDVDYPTYINDMSERL